MTMKNNNVYFSNQIERDQVSFLTALGKHMSAETNQERYRLLEQQEETQAINDHTIRPLKMNMFRAKLRSLKLRSDMRKFQKMAYKLTEDYFRQELENL